MFARLRAEIIHQPKRHGIEQPWRNKFAYLLAVVTLIIYLQHGGVVLSSLHLNENLNSPDWKHMPHNYIPANV